MFSGQDSALTANLQVHSGVCFSARRTVCRCAEGHNGAPFQPAQKIWRWRWAAFRKSEELESQNWFSLLSRHRCCNPVVIFFRYNNGYVIRYNNSHVRVAVFFSWNGRKGEANFPGLIHCAAHFIWCWCLHKETLWCNDASQWRTLRTLCLRSRVCTLFNAEHLCGWRDTLSTRSTVKVLNRNSVNKCSFCQPCFFLHWETPMLY